jgi:transcriptional regulator with XRE-family HTH domain
MFLGKRLRELRKNMGLTQQQLGNMVNVTKVSICCYENNTRIPNLETLEDLTKVLKVEPNYFLGNDIRVVKENDEKYSMLMSNEDIEILNILKEHKDLYNKLINDPKRIIDLIDKKMK